MLFEELFSKSKWRRMNEPLEKTHIHQPSRPEHAFLKTLWCCWGQQQSRKVESYNWEMGQYLILHTSYDLPNVAACQEVKFRLYMDDLSSEITICLFSRHHMYLGPTKLMDFLILFFFFFLILVHHTKLLFIFLALHSRKLYTNIQSFFFF